MKQKKISLLAQRSDKPLGIQFKKSIIDFQWFRSYKFFNETLQPRFFTKKKKIFML
jgi:hypothetical protein